MKIIVCGYIIGYPLGGMTWHHLNYLLGLEQLGHEVVFYEDSGQWLWPYNPLTNTSSEDPSYGIEYLIQTFAKEGVRARWCYYSELQHRYYGMQHREWVDQLSHADLLICISGVTPWREEFARVERTCVIDTDPVFTQLRMCHDPEFLAYYKRFDRIATFGKLIGTSESPLPTSGISWIGTNQPIAMDHWPKVSLPAGSAFSTIGKWEHSSDRHVEYKGQTYASSKGVEWMKLLELPRRTRWCLEMAMASIPTEIQHQFESFGWQFTDPTHASISPQAYRAFIQSRSGELTVAKQIYAGLPSGWFSDRSAAFLASGRPVVTQSSGFERWLPTGAGLFSFSTLEQAAEALETIASDPIRHADAAYELARDYFDSRIVLNRLLNQLS